MLIVPEYPGPAWHGLWPKVYAFWNIVYNICICIILYIMTLGQAMRLVPIYNYGAKLINNISMNQLAVANDLFLCMFL